MDPADFECSDVVITGEASEVNSSRINTIGFDVNTEIDVGIVLIIVVRGGDIFECADVSESFNLIVLPFEPCL